MAFKVILLMQTFFKHNFPSGSLVLLTYSLFVMPSSF